MRTPLLLGWLLVPVLAGAYHYGPGQEKIRLDDVSIVLASADSQAGQAEWLKAAEGYEQALALLPAERKDEVRRVRLERDKAWMNSKKLPEANTDLRALVEELQNDPSADKTTLAEARESFASAQYYTTWLMKLEGLSRDEWEPEIESARQTYKLLVEQADSTGDASTAGRSRQDLESAIRLARMEPGDLQGMPIPKQCQGCKSCNCKKPGKKPSKNSTKKDSRGAGEGPPPDGSGS